MTECQCGGQPDGPHTDICYLQGEIERLRAELAKANRQINRCVDQNKYLESTITRLRAIMKQQRIYTGFGGWISLTDADIDKALAAPEKTQ